MSLAKYVSLLGTKSVFFARADTLGDDFEGAQTPRTVQRREEFREFVERRGDVLGGSYNARQLTFASCWHLCDHETEWMWKRYIPSGEGVAIQSRFDLLRECLAGDGTGDSGQYCIYTGCMNYADFDNAHFSDDWVTPYIYKRENYQDEREVRALIFLHRGQPKSPPAEKDLKPGLQLKVDLNVLVEAVRTPPSAQGWFCEAVSSLTQRYGLNVPVTESEVTSRRPQF